MAKWLEIIAKYALNRLALDIAQNLFSVDAILDELESAGHESPINEGVMSARNIERCYVIDRLARPFARSESKPPLKHALRIAYCT